MSSNPAHQYSQILREDLTPFIYRSLKELFPHATVLPNWHVELIATKLEEVRNGTCRRLIINLPPRHLKSHAASIAFIAWLLGHDSTKQVLSVSYGQDLADHLARQCRKLMRSPFYQSLFATRLSPDREAISDFETVSGGYRLSTSITGVLTGRGADVIVIDDPIKAGEVISDARRKAVNEWYDDTLRSRLNNQETGAIIIVMQRLHADDLVAHVQQHEDWDVLSLPLIAEEDERHEFANPYGLRTIERKKGDILHPGVMSMQTIETQRRGMSEYVFAAQFQQNPQPYAGLIVLRKWLRFYKLTDRPEKFDRVIQSWDTASKTTELANYSVCTTWGLYKKRMYLLDVFRRKLTFPELKRAVLELADLHDATVVLIEDKASGISLIQELQAEGFSCVQAAPSMDGDKEMRLRSQTAKIEGGFVLFPEDAPWLNEYLNELLSFPNGKHDDQVDSTVFALAWNTVNKPYLGWTAESLAALERLATPSLFHSIIPRQGW